MNKEEFDIKDDNESTEETREEEDDALNNDPPDEDDDNNEEEDKEESKDVSSAQSKPVKSKGTDRFKEVINEYLINRGLADPLFAETLKKPNKSIDECVNYIINTVQKSGCNGFADDEIYGMAIHYYDEDNIEVGKATSATVVVNHKVELTAEEIQEAKDAARKKAEEDQYKKITKKTHVSKPVSKEAIQSSLF